MQPAKLNKTISFETKGIGKQIAMHLSRLDIFNDFDLVLHLPVRYQDRSKVTPIKTLIPGNNALITGEISSLNFPRGGKTKLICHLRDQSGIIVLRFFHLLPFQLKFFEVGKIIQCFGEVRLGPSGLEMFHPECHVLDLQSRPPQTLTPIYSSTSGLSQKLLRKLINQVLDQLSATAHLKDLLPPELLKKFSLPTLEDCIRSLHYPSVDFDEAQLLQGNTLAHKRLSFEELLAHRLSILQIKSFHKTKKAKPLLEELSVMQDFIASLPFRLTHAQERVYQEIKTDLRVDKPMLRLLQGDVGSGKTIVSALTILNCIASGYQAVLMAPTEILAEQHYQNFQMWFEKLSINCCLLTSRIAAKLKKSHLTAIACGQAQLIIGTHAVFQQDVKFKNLALVVIDEQHRFGVEQRAALLAKSEIEDQYPHQLIMTATPIPRTLAMALYTELDFSVINELPPGRIPVKTSIISSAKRDDLIAKIRERLNEGQQIYWVCPLIEESENWQGQAANQALLSLQSLLPEAKVGLIHGRMKTTEKNTVMENFKRNLIQLLVATSVIEVGVDVPNASLMIIENAERLGLAQLHQLRGRVGRGSIESHCILLYQGPLSAVAKARLNIMRETNDGFKIAEKDLELRGPGELFGTRQKGDISFRIADLLRDGSLLPQVQIAADLLLSNYADLIPEILSRWLKNNHDEAII